MLKQVLIALALLGWGTVTGMGVYAAGSPPAHEETGAAAPEAAASGTVASGFIAYKTAASESAAPESAASESAAPESAACKDCHAAEVEGYAHSTMDHSLRRAGREPEGSVTFPEGTIRVESSPEGTEQILESDGSRMAFPIDYVIGSGKHASGYLVDLGDHLFQSPIAYYTRRRAYGPAPGAEAMADPAFTRPVTPGCLFCHSGAAVHVSGTDNEYRSPPFTQTAIGCSRCHGSAAEHLADPGPGNIVNPAKLAVAERDAICEQCHLIGVARVLNPGKSFSDFQPGQPLEDTFTIFHNVPVPGTVGAFRVISQAEQLALSLCARRSGGRLWCGTCHDPHHVPEQPVAYYRAICLTCHRARFPGAPHPDARSDCIGCHMPKRQTSDGGHTAFTDHRIQRSPEPQVQTAEVTDIAAWREPAPSLQKRNLGIALIQVGMQRKTPAMIIRGYRLLTEVQTDFPQDSELYTWIGNALLTAHQYGEAERAYDIALGLDPNSPQKETHAGEAYAAAGALDKARQHLERALALDRLDLQAANLLMQVYKEQGDSAAMTVLSDEIQQSMHPQ